MIGRSGTWTRMCWRRCWRWSGGRWRRRRPSCRPTRAAMPSTPSRSPTSPRTTLPNRYLIPVFLLSLCLLSLLVLVLGFLFSSLVFSLLRNTWGTAKEAAGVHPRHSHRHPPPLLLWNKGLSLCLCKSPHSKNIMMLKMTTISRITKILFLYYYDYWVCTSNWLLDLSRYTAVVVLLSKFNVEMKQSARTRMLASAWAR